MRWDALFDDLEGQLSRLDGLDLAAEVAERARAERARITLSRRLLAHHATTLRVWTASGDIVGTVEDVAPAWLVLAEDVTRVLIPTSAVLRVDGLGRHLAAEPGKVLRSLSLGHALRALARDRAGVAVMVAGAAVTGTIDRVGADHLDLAMHAPGELRRRQVVVGPTTICFSAIDWVKSAPR